MQEPWGALICRKRGGMHGMRVSASKLRMTYGDSFRAAKTGWPSMVIGNITHTSCFEAVTLNQ